MNEVRTSSRKTRVGKVVSDKMDKTVAPVVGRKQVVQQTQLRICAVP